MSNLQNLTTILAELRKFVYRSYLRMLACSLSNRFNPLSVWKTFLHCFGGFVFILIFIPKAVLYSQTASKFEPASKNKNEFSKYERGKSLIQRQHPSNVQLPTTRRGIHSTPNSPAIPKGVVIDRILSIVCCFNKGYSNLMNPKDGDELEGRYV